MNYDFDTFFSKAQEAAAPFSGLTEFGFDTFDKGIKMQAELLGDSIDLAVDQLKLVSSATTPSEYLQGQTKLAEQYVGRVQERAQTLAAAAAEMQAMLATMAEQGVKQAQAIFGETVAAAQAAAPKTGAKKTA
jgi:phasin family protein